MLKLFFKLEWKSFFRSASFGTKLAMKIFMGLLMAYFAICFGVLGFSVYFILEDEKLKPFEVVNAYLMYYFLADLVIRYFFQQMPVTNIRPLLLQNLTKSNIVHFSIWKTLSSFFNWGHAFFFLPFTIVLIYKGFNPFGVIAWHIAMICFVYMNNFLCLLSNNSNKVFYGLLALVVMVVGGHYFGYFNLGEITGPAFESIYSQYWPLAVVVAIAALLYKWTFAYFSGQMRLDTGLATKTSSAHTENFSWLDQWGTLGTFLKNDIRLIKRNKRARMSVMMSFFFLFYGLIFMNDQYKDMQFMHIFAGIFVSGGFLFIFGQFVPSWDSSYYPLMMSQNIPYRTYLQSKWTLIVIATAISTVLASFYLYFSTTQYLMIVSGAIYNVGCNAHLVLLGGAFNKTPIDLASGQQAFGQKQSFNAKTMLLGLPKMVLPMGLFALGNVIHSEFLGMGLVAVAGVIGFAFKEKVFTLIESIYKKEKFAALAAYKQQS